MTKIDIISGFLGAGKTTFIKKILKDAVASEKVVLIENEFGEISVDGGFLKEAGVTIREMSQGCICCSLVGDFEKALAEVVDKFAPDRIIVEPTGVGALSDVMKAVARASKHLDVTLNCAVTVVDVKRCRTYAKNFGAFFSDQIKFAGTIVLTRTDIASPEQIEEAYGIVRGINPDAEIVTTPLAQLSGEKLLSVMEKKDDMLAELIAQAGTVPDGEDPEEHAHHHHHEDEDGHEHGHHHHHEDDDEDEDEDEEEHGHHHHHEDDDDEDEEGHEHGHHHHHEDDEDEDEHEHDHHHHEDDDDEDEDEHEHHHEHHHGCCHEHHHEYGHHHDHEADEVFESMGREGVAPITKEKLENALKELSEGSGYGTILRAKGMLESAAKDGTWFYFDLVPGQYEIRTGAPEFTGRYCVIGAQLEEEAVKALFT